MTISRYFASFLEGSNQIYKAVLFSEQELGIKETVCRKSIHRILNRLAETNMIKKYEVEIEEEGQPPKTFVYYCDATITREDQLFKTAVNETKFRIKGIGKFSAIFQVTDYKLSLFFLYGVRQGPFPASFCYIARFHKGFVTLLAFYCRNGTSFCTET